MSRTVYTYSRRNLKEVVRERMRELFGSTTFNSRVQNAVNIKWLIRFCYEIVFFF